MVYVAEITGLGGHLGLLGLCQLPRHRHRAGEAKMTFEVTALAKGVSQRDGVEGNPEIGVALCIWQRHVDGLCAIKRQPAMCESDSQATNAKTFDIDCASIYGEALRISETILPTHLSEALRPLDSGEQLAIGAEVIEHRALIASSGLAVMTVTCGALPYCWGHRSRALPFADQYLPPDVRAACRDHKVLVAVVAIVIAIVAIAADVTMVEAGGLAAVDAAENLNGLPAAATKAASGSAEGHHHATSAICESRLAMTLSIYRSTSASTHMFLLPTITALGNSWDTVFRHSVEAFQLIPFALRPALSSSRVDMLLSVASET